MHTSIVRIQNVFGFFTTVAFAVAAFIALSDFASPRTPASTVAVNSVQTIRGRPHYYSTKLEEYAVIKFTLSTDLSSLFNWNTKQVFVWVSASWPNATGTELVNEAVIWDTIITNPSADHLQNIKPLAMKKLVKSAKGKSVDPSRGKLLIKNQKAKYQITAPSGKLANTENVVLTVHYNIQPWVGMLTWTPRVGGWGPMGEFWMWKKMKGGVSKAFAFPALKPKKAASAA